MWRGQLDMGIALSVLFLAFSHTDKKSLPFPWMLIKSLTIRWEKYYCICFWRYRQSDKCFWFFLPLPAAQLPFQLCVVKWLYFRQRNVTRRGMCNFHFPNRKLLDLDFSSCLLADWKAGIGSQHRSCRQEGRPREQHSLAWNILALLGLD